ncbi:MAG: A24 family peptidase [Gammaproteobacteria bacterium]|nr:A24 family peptidase [Gammaproteobacteria bacterium]
MSTLILGLLVGSFLNVVIARLPVMLETQWRSDCQEFLQITREEGPRETFNLVVPRSRCPQCGHQITALENVPVLSYLVLRGRCSQCGTGISLQYPLVEVVTGALSAFAAWQFGLTWATGAALLFTWSLVALTVIDLHHQLLPDTIVFPLLWLGLLLSPLVLFSDPVSSIFGAALGYLALWSVYWAFKLLTGKEGMGYGDFKLLAAIGAWLGWQNLPLTILIASATGAVIGVTLTLLGRHQRGAPIPFGPFLAAGGWCALMWGTDLNALYLG